MTIAQPKPLVLYVEDDPDTLRLASLRLESRYELLGATTDREACALISQHAERLFAVLMDIELQGSQLDGIALVKAMRGLSPRAGLPPWAQTLPKLPHLPVIVLTAFASRYPEADVKAAGATHLLAKPIDFARLNLALAQANIQSVMARLASQPSKR